MAAADWANASPEKNKTTQSSHEVDRGVRKKPGRGIGRLLPILFNLHSSGDQCGARSSPRIDSSICFSPSLVRKLTSTRTTLIAVQRRLSHSGAYLAVRLANGAMALLTLYVLTRLMSAEQYGLYALGLAALNICAAVNFQWLVVGVARFYPLHAQDPRVLLASVRKIFFVLVAATGALALLLLTARSWFELTRSLGWTLIALVWAGSVAMAWQNLHLQIVNARGLPLRYGLISTVRSAVTLLCAVLIIKYTADGVVVLAATVMGCLTAVTLFGSPALPTLKRDADSGTWNQALAASLIRYGGPLSLTYIAVMLVDQSDRFFIAWWSGAQAVAGYAAAYDLAQQTAGAVLNVFFLAHYPKITSAWEQGGAQAARIAMAPLARGLVLTAPLVCGFFAGLAPEIAAAMFGASLQSDATTVLPWIAFAVTMGSLRAFCFDIAFHVTKNSVAQLGAMATMAATNLSLNLLLIPRFGVLGAAISTTVAMGLGALASAWWGRKVGVYPPMGLDLCKAALIALLTAFVLRGSSHWDGHFIGWSLRLGTTCLLFGLTVWVLNLGQIRSLGLALVRARSAAG